MRPASGGLIWRDSFRQTRKGLNDLTNKLTPFLSSWPTDRCVSIWRADRSQQACRRLAQRSSKRSDLVKVAKTAGRNCGNREQDQRSEARRAFPAGGRKIQRLLNIQASQRQKISLPVLRSAPTFIPRLAEFAAA